MSTPSGTVLFQPYAMGNIHMKNHVVMAPMTRSRALGNVPNDLMAQYYGERASAGLIVTEGTAPTPDALGYARIPGIFSAAQVEGWKKVSHAVHAGNGRIFMQLMHTGRIGHPLNQPQGARLLAPSAVRAVAQMHTDQEGSLDMPEPSPMTASDIESVRAGFVTAAKNAVEAGLDGIELHGANGYLLEQFLSPHTNRRTDGYGGSPDARNRFLIEVAREVRDAIGAGKVGVRISPHNTFNDMVAFDDSHNQYVALGRALSDLGIAYLHVVRTPDARAAETIAALRTAFKSTLILNAGFELESAEAALEAGDADLVAFGRPFLANPDLVARLEKRAPLNPPDFTKLYTPGPEGYVGYPNLS